MPRPTETMGAAEYHARWAMREYAPCSECSPAYRAKFAELRTLGKAADMLFDRAYEAYVRLTELSLEERRAEE